MLPDSPDTFINHFAAVINTGELTALRTAADLVKDVLSVDTTQQTTDYTMHILWMLIIGLVIGAIAKLIMPGKDPGGIIVTMLLGVAGALIAGFLGRAIGWYHEGEPAGFIASVIGAIVLLAIYRMVLARRST